MNFSKVKMVMIVCLVAANILIAVLCTSIYKGKYYISEREAELAQSHLESVGVNVQFFGDDLKKHSLPVYLSKGQVTEKEVPRIYTIASEAFFKRSIHDTEYVDIPDGYSVSIKNNDGDPIGASSFTGGMNFVCYLEGYSDSNITETVSKSYFSVDGTFGGERKNEDSAKKFVENGFKRSNLDIRMLGSKEFGEGTIVYFGVFLSDKAVYDVYLNLYVIDTEIVCLCGNLPDSDLQKTYSTEMFDIIDAVYTFLELYAVEDTDYSSDFAENSGDGLGINIDNAEVMYKMIKNGAEDYYYIPVWKIDYTDSKGDTMTAVFDALIGENVYS